MAERVDFRRESKPREAIMSILKTHKLVDEKQIRIIMQKWYHFEYKISGTSRSFEVYCNYIKYQETLLQFIHNKMYIKRSIKEILETYLRNDIKQLIQVCMDTPAYQGEFDMFVLKLSFYRMTKDYTTGNAAVDTLIQTHPSNPKTWTVASQWYADLDQPDSGIHVLHKGLQMLGDPVNIEVCHALIQLEIDAALGKHSKDILSKEQLDGMKEVLVNKLDVYVNEFKQRKWVDSKFLFVILDKFYELNIEESKIDHLKEIIADKFGDFYDTWQQLIQLDKIDNNLIRIIQRYQEGFVKLASNPTECCRLRSSYLEYLLYVLATTEVTQSSYEESKKFVMDAFQDAADCHMLEENHYLNWFDFTSDDEFEPRLDQGLQDFPNSVELWNVKINCILMHYEKDKREFDSHVFDIFDKATEACGEAAIDIWNSMLRHIYVHGNADQVEAIYRKGIAEKQPAVIVNELKPRFIEWLAIAKDSDIAIREYHILCELKPYCKPLHEVALTIRSFNSKEIKLKAYALLCKQFNNDGDVYFRFVRYHCLFNINETIMTRKEAIQKIYEEARENLDEKNIFFQQFNNLKDKEMIYAPDEPNET